MAERETPDLVFLDIKMPGMDGLEVLQRLQGRRRGAAGRDDLRARARSRTAVEATKLGAFDFIEKPLASERVLVTVRNALDRSRLRRREPRRCKRAWRCGTRSSARAPALQRVLDADPPRGADQRHGADHGRERRRQGAGRARHPSQQPARARAVRAGELRGHSRRPDRVGAVRPREGLVHRRHREADRQVRAGRQGHDLPRRSRRHEPEDAGQGAARAAGGRGRAARLGADDQGGRARDRGDEQEPRGGDREGRRSARISTSAST